ncbi:hypothetical protein APA_725 [Pseudanabaena sp. lw0831]|nr:hypothetical protein APA_725 [Pseudanabaena sp. lw0831]
MLIVQKSKSSLIFPIYLNIYQKKNTPEWGCFSFDRYLRLRDPID